MSLLKNIQAYLVNIALSLLVLLLAYGAAEWVFLRFFDRVFPMSMLSKLDEPDGLWPLLQTSKRGLYPERYIALIGDSYAMGMGDAMYENKPDAYRPRFSSAHTIQDLTGRDVVAFGQPGSGSMRGAISNPVTTLRYLRKMVNSELPDPDWILLYFYEGNDLTENWMYYEKTFLADHTAADYDQPQIFDRYVQDIVLGRQHLYLATDAATWKNYLFFSRFVYRLFAEAVLGKKFYRKKYPDEFRLIYVPESRWVPRKLEQSINHAQVDGKVVALPDNLQGPSMDLSPEQLVQTVGTFEKALAKSRTYFPRTQFAVVYIPSVLSTYHLVSKEVEAQNFFSDTQTRFPVAEVERRHVWIKTEIANIAHAQGVKFIDTTADLRLAAQRQTLHGPRDWNHFSRKGYEVLGASVVRQLPELQQQ